MDQKKIGSFLRELRKERDLTQEQAAEKLNVSARTISRWETGSNMPDLSILVEIADLYEVDIREIFNGERKSGEMEKELKDTLEQAAAYSSEEKKKIRQNMIEISASTAFILLFAVVLSATNGFGGRIPERSMNNMMDFATGLSLSILILNALYLAGIVEKVKALWRGRGKR